MIYDVVYGNIANAIVMPFFAYYFVWIAITPFIDTTHFSQRIFPPREYGLLIPAVILLIILTVSVTLIGYHLIMQTGMKEKQALMEQRAAAKAAAAKAPTTPPPGSMMGGASRLSTPSISREDMGGNSNGNNTNGAANGSGSSHPNVHHRAHHSHHERHGSFGASLSNAMAGYATTSAFGTASPRTALGSGGHHQPRTHQHYASGGGGHNRQFSATQSTPPLSMYGIGGSRAASGSGSNGFYGAPFGGGGGSGAFPTTSAAAAAGGIYGSDLGGYSRGSLADGEYTRESPYGVHTRGAAAAAFQQDHQ